MIATVSIAFCIQAKNLLKWDNVKASTKTKFIRKKEEIE